jgi:hypothetical protein
VLQELQTPPAEAPKAELPLTGSEGDLLPPAETVPAAPAPAAPAPAAPKQ